MWFAVVNNCMILMGDVFTRHCKSVDVDGKKCNFSIEELLNASLNISRVAYFFSQHLLSSSLRFDGFLIHKLQIFKNFSINCHIETSYCHFSTSWHGRNFKLQIVHYKYVPLAKVWQEPHEFY